MGNDSKALQSNLVLSLLIWAGFGLLVINALAFIHAVTAPHIRADVFRHLQDIVLPIMQGREGVSVLWTNHHPAPLMHIIQIVNLKYFGFRLDYDTYLGLFFQIATTGLILLSIASTTVSPKRNLRVLGALGALVILAIALGFNSLAQYAWPLLALQQYLLFFGIVVFLLVDRSVLAKASSWYLAVVVAATFLIFANASFGTIFLASMLGILSLSYFIDRQAAFIRPALALIGVVVAHRLFMVLVVPEVGGGPVVDVIGILKALLMSPLRTMTQFSIGLSSGLVDIVLLKDRFPDAEQLLILFSRLLTALFVVVFIVYLKKGLFRTSMTPLALMLFAVLFGASSLVFRFWFLDLWGLATPRYVPNFKLGVIGMLWALWLIVNDSEALKEKLFRRLTMRLAAFCVVAILLIQALQISAGWDKAAAMQEDNHNHALGVYLAGTVPENKVALPFRIRGFPQDKKHLPEVLAYLKRNDLNVFSENFPPSSILDQHKAARSLFAISDIAVIVSSAAGEAGHVTGRASELEANWEIDPQEILVSNTGGEPLYLRFELQSDAYLSRGFGILEPGSGQSRNMDIYRGRSNVFFELKAGTQMAFETPEGAIIKAFEIRG